MNTLHRSTKTVSIAEITLSNAPANKFSNSVPYNPTTSSMQRQLSPPTQTNIKNPVKSDWGLCDAASSSVATRLRPAAAAV